MLRNCIQEQLPVVFSENRILNSLASFQVDTRVSQKSHVQTSHPCLTLKNLHELQTIEAQHFFILIVDSDLGSRFKAKL